MGPDPASSRPKGARTREAILGRAVNVASVEGLDGLSIGALASDLSLSKSGLFAHFGSKEELQLAAAATAREVFVSRVVRPALALAPGLEQLLALCDGYLRYSEDRVFPGGCFFFATTAELAGQVGAVHDEVTTQMNSWLALLNRTLISSQGAGELRLSVDIDMLSFEISSFLTTANWLSVALGKAGAYPSARRSIGRALAEAGADQEVLRAALG